MLVYLVEIEAPDGWRRLKILKIDGRLFGNAKADKRAGNMVAISSTHVTERLRLSHTQVHQGEYLSRGDYRYFRRGEEIKLEQKRDPSEQRSLL